MNLIENEEAISRNKNTKKIMITIVVLIIILLGVCVYLLYMIDNIQKNTLKLTVNNKSTKVSEDMFIFEGDNLYVAIKDFGELLGYTPYNGDYKNRRYSENTTECYIEIADEVASYSLNSNTMYKKETDSEDYEYFELEEPVKMINDKLYVIKEGIEIGTNSLIQYDSTNNKVSVISLDYLVNFYSNKISTAAVIDKGVEFSNKKALRYNLVVVKNKNGFYGVYSADGKEIIGTKYKNITFKEDSQEFTVTTYESKI